MGLTELPNIFPDIGRATRFVLFSDFGPEEAVPSLQSWREESGTLIFQGLAGAALRAVRERSIGIPADVYERLQRAQFDDISATTTIVRRSKGGVDALRSEGISFVVTKGPGTALAGARISERPYFDLDIVVHPSRFREARNVLSSIGYAELSRSVPPWDSFNRLCREGINLRTQSGGSIDLHHRISPWCWSEGLSFDVLCKAVRPTDIFGVQLPLAATEHNLLVSALHVVSDKNRPGQTYRIWRDVLVLARTCAVEAVVATAVETEMAAWLAWILSCFPAEVRPWELLEHLTDERLRVKRSSRLKMLLPPRFGSMHLFGQNFRIPPSHAVLFTTGMLVPSPAFLRLKYPEETHRYLKWWRESLRSYNQETRDNAIPKMQHAQGE